MEEEKKKQHIILVHGAGHGGWCWYKVATRLRSAGHRVTVPDLAASGIDSRKHSELSSFDDYVEPLMDIMAGLAPEEKVILVGHSLGGISIASAMDRFPDRVAVGIFLTAFRPDCTHHPSYFLDQQFQRNPSLMDCQLSFADNSADALPTSLLFGPQFIASKLYQLCPPEDITLATTLVRPTPLFLQDLQKAPPFSEDRYGSVASIYIKCHKDLAILEEFQNQMIQNQPVQEVIEIEGADHMAMMSTPNELCELILRVSSNDTA